VPAAPGAPGVQGRSVGAAGLVAADHPLLGAAIDLAGGDGLILTGRLSLDDHPWLADHVVFDHVLLPATAFLELALAAARRAGLARVDELALWAPLPLPRAGAVQLQLTVGAADDAGRRPLAIHARPETAAQAGPGADDARWTRHASGALAPGAAYRDVEPRDDDLRAWPPEDAVPVDLDHLHDQLAAAGLAYGPGFRGLSAAWRRGDDVFAEVRLPACVDPDAARRFAIQPGLARRGAARARHRRRSGRSGRSGDRVSGRPGGAPGRVDRRVAPRRRRHDPPGPDDRPRR